MELSTSPTLQHIHQAVRRFGGQQGHLGFLSHGGNPDVQSQLFTHLRQSIAQGRSAPCHGRRTCILLNLVAHEKVPGRHVRMLMGFQNRGPQIRQACTHFGHHPSFVWTIDNQPTSLAFLQFLHPREYTFKTRRFGANHLRMKKGVLFSRLKKKHYEKHFSPPLPGCRRCRLHRMRKADCLRQKATRPCSPW